MEIFWLVWPEIFSVEGVAVEEEETPSVVGVVDSAEVFFLLLFPLNLSCRMLCCPSA